MPLYTLYEYENDLGQTKCMLCECAMYDLVLFSSHKNSKFAFIKFLQVLRPASSSIFHAWLKVLINMSK